MRIVTLLAAALCAAAWPMRLGAAQPVAAPRGVLLADGGRARAAIHVDADAPPAAALAAGELARYFGRISGAAFTVRHDDAGGRAVVLRTDPALAGEAYTISIRGDSVLLAGGSGRAVLYAAYDLLERLGVRFLAPAFDHDATGGEVVPHTARLRYASTSDVAEQPVLRDRILDVAQAASQDAVTLRRIVAWMPKARYNVLRVPHKRGGREKWDLWRGAVAPELARREIALEVGGHGYESYLDADMEGGALFAQHPDWFGKDAQCRPSRVTRDVFNTESPEAVRYVLGRVIDYLGQRPEIDVFDFWPPDGVRWAECPEWQAFGTPEDRQMRLVNQLDSALRTVRPDVRLEIVAYALALGPPAHTPIPASLIVDFCPIDQSFDAPLSDTTVANNRHYVEVLRQWRRAFPGTLRAYTYYRKYAWRSLPVVIPHYMQRDMRWYAGVPVQGISTYAEPADWFTYELNHYAFARLAWNPDLDVDALIADYVAARYDDESRPARAALAALEDVYRLRGSIPFSAPDPPGELAAADAELATRQAAVRAAAARAGQGSARSRTVAAKLRKLDAVLEFARRDLHIQERRTLGATPAELSGMVAELVRFWHEHEGEGLFLTRTPDDDATRLTKHYTTESTVKVVEGGA